MRFALIGSFEGNSSCKVCVYFIPDLVSSADSDNLPFDGVKYTGTAVLF